MRPLHIVLILLAIVLLGSPAAALAEPLSPEATRAMETDTYLRVTRAYGATLRRGPSDDAISTQVLKCGEVFPVIRQADGWTEVWTGYEAGWVSTSRATVGALPLAADCRDVRTLRSMQSPKIQTNSTNVDLRASASDQSVVSGQLPNGQRVDVVDGPITSPDNQDWYLVTSQDDPDIRGWVHVENVVV